jgi:hypothetical protein
MKALKIENTLVVCEMQKVKQASKSWEKISLETCIFVVSSQYIFTKHAEKDVSKNYCGKWEERKTTHTQFCVGGEKNVCTSHDYKRYIDLQ